MLPYKMQLSPGDALRFLDEYGAPMEDNPGVLNVTWFSSEAHFHLDAYKETQDPLEK
jgi:hypothetical protein